MNIVEGCPELIDPSLILVNGSVEEGLFPTAAKLAIAKPLFKKNYFCLPQVRSRSNDDLFISNGIWVDIFAKGQFCCLQKMKNKVSMIILKLTTNESSHIREMKMSHGHEKPFVFKRAV